MYGPNQVGELIIGNASASQTTVKTFIASAADKAIKVLNEAGTIVTAGNPFAVYQKTSGDSGKGLNYEFSGVIDPNKVEKVTLKAYAPEVQEVFTATVGTATANTTYEIEVRLYNDGGSLSPENFAIIQGFYVTGTSAETTTAIKDGLVSSLQKNLIKRGNFELDVASTGASTFTITGKAQKTIPGKIIGKQIEFDVLGKSFSNTYDTTQPVTNSGLVTIVNTTSASPGSGTGKFAANFEWFVKGMKYEVYRQTGYPAEFGTPYYANVNGIYNTIQIKYYSERKETSVERQYKVLTILVEKASDTLANNAATNSVLTDLTTAIGTRVTMPSALPVV